LKEADVEQLYTKKKETEVKAQTACIRSRYFVGGYQIQKGVGCSMYEPDDTLTCRKSKIEGASRIDGAHVFMFGLA
jgi:hypothetical protein